jgi:predicted DNA-binding transcriptional regulator AlpA
MPSNLLNEKECAVLLGVQVSTLRVWRSTKRYDLCWHKIGRSVKYSQSEIDRFIASRKVSGGGDQ